LFSGDLLGEGVLSDALLGVLVCPRSKQPLIYFPRGERDVDEAEACFIAPASRLRYRIDAGVPVLLVEEAEELSETQVARWIERAKQLGLQVPG
jgi:uncharacterized protein YbaR (Trm112 family)